MHVTFNEDVKVSLMFLWKYAYHKARIGPWEQVARDRVRFQRRIQNCEKIIAKVLHPLHREKVYNALKLK